MRTNTIIVVLERGLIKNAKIGEICKALQGFGVDTKNGEITEICKEVSLTSARRGAEVNVEKFNCHRNRQVAIS